MQQYNRGQLPDLDMTLSLHVTIYEKIHRICPDGPTSQLIRTQHLFIYLHTALKVTESSFHLNEMNVSCIGDVPRSFRVAVGEEDGAPYSEKWRRPGTPFLSLLQMQRIQK